MTRPAAGHRLEDVAVRVMYFFNTMDTFLPASVIFYLGIWYFGANYAGAAWAHLFPAFTRSWPAALLLAGVLYLFLKAGDFHPLFVPFCAGGSLWLLLTRQSSGGELGIHFLWMFIVTSAVQIVFMGFPMALAARSPIIPLRMYLNSFVIIAPTTLSLPLTIFYQLFIINASVSLNPVHDFPSLIFLFALAAATLLVRRFRKRGFIPDTLHPVSLAPLCRRVMVLNIDGLSQRAFDSISPPFLKALEKKSAVPSGGAYTVYRALTNPAFASILTGAEPARHGVVNNNSGREIRVQALPDIIPARLYGSMHVRHFSRPQWAVTVVSLVERGYRNADAWLVERIKCDLLQHRNDVRLWVADFSAVDYCGHAWGSYSRRMKDALRGLDRLLEEFFGWLKENGLFEDTLFIVSSDHGLHIGEHSFILHPAEERVPLLFAGKRIKPQRLAMKVSIIDIAANISYALNAPYCAGSRGRVFREIFLDPAGSSHVVL